MSWRQRRPRPSWPPLVFGVAFLALWEAAVNVFDWKPYFLPKPSRIWDEFTDNLDQIWAAARVSGGNALDRPARRHRRSASPWRSC